MIGAAERYLELLVDIAVRRARAGGVLEPQEESELVEALDRCWRAMTDDEQDVAERAYAERRRVVAPASLGFEDQAVGPGRCVGPRRVA